MKRILLIALFSFAILFSSYAQTERGNMLLGATTSGSFSNGSTNIWNLSLNPKAGLFVANNLLFGSEVTSGVSLSSSLNSYNLGISGFGRYYLGSGKVRPYVFAKYGYQTSSLYFSDEALRTIRDNDQFAQVGLGAAYFISPRFAIETDFGYNIGGFSASQTFFTVGLSYYFSRGKNKSKR